MSETLFANFIIPSTSVFYSSSKLHTKAFVNLRPIVPGHVLVIPQRIVPLLEDLTDDEYLDLWTTVRKVQQMLRVHYDCQAFNVAVQDGRAAGQSVPHVHVHILPRKAGDYERNDDVYADLEEWAPRPSTRPLPDNQLTVADDSERRDRTPEEMAEEAEIYRKVLQSML